MSLSSSDHKHIWPMSLSKLHLSPFYSEVLVHSSLSSQAVQSVEGQCWSSSCAVDIRTLPGVSSVGVAVGFNHVLESRTISAFCCLSYRNQMQVQQCWQTHVLTSVRNSQEVAHIRYCLFWKGGRKADQK